MTKALTSDGSACRDLSSQIVEIGIELARDDPRRAAAMMAAAGIPLRVIVRVVSEPTLRRSHSRQ